MLSKWNQPISTHWKSLSKWQATVLVVVGLVLELPVRWIVRPDIPYMYLGNPWFNLPLRIFIELGFILIMIPLALGMKAPLRALSLVWRRWTKWEWIAFAIVGTIELTIVILVAGHRWPTLFAAGVIDRALLWAFAEFLDESVL